MAKYGFRPTAFMMYAMRSSRSEPLCSPWIDIGSPMMFRTFMRGFSEEYGSWNTICIRRRKERSAPPFSPVSSVPSKFTDPAVGR